MGHISQVTTGDEENVVVPINIRDGIQLRELGSRLCWGGGEAFNKRFEDTAGAYSPDGSLIMSMLSSFPRVALVSAPAGADNHDHLHYRVRVRAAASFGLH